MRERIACRAGPDVVSDVLLESEFGSCGMGGPVLDCYAASVLFDHGNSMRSRSAKSIKRQSRRGPGELGERRRDWRRKAALTSALFELPLKPNKKGIITFLIQDNVEAHCTRILSHVKAVALLAGAPRQGHARLAREECLPRFRPN